MILRAEQLQDYQGEVAMVDGCFDPIHNGHIAYFKAASELGLPVLCSVSGNSYLINKHRPFLPEDQRAAIIDSIRYIDYTYLNKESTASVLQALRPKYYVKGKDWEGRLPQEELAICEESGIEIVFVDTVMNSSTKILESFSADSGTDGARIREFEDLVFDQKPFDGGEYDEEYFNDEWRDGGNSYALETRRKLEAKNPQLIKEVFEPKKALDFGCGPGALMYLLNEIGVEADGIDFSPHSRALAPAAVRDRIIVGSVTEPLVADNSYDLIICREVLEHLTVLQIRLAVANMCRASSRYIYLTTRFHPDPPDLLAVTDQKDVDETHITLLNKDFVRVLFMLEGYRSRPDLENRMDWLNKGRVLVFEKQSLSI